MKTRPKLKGIAVALSAVGLFGITDAMAGKFVCNTIMFGGTINANIEVQEGAHCILNGTTVNGNIDVKSNDADGGGEVYFGRYDGGEGSHCFNVSNVYGNISVKGSKNAF